MQIHNQRESKESKNEDIDHERTPLNYDLHNPEHISYTKRVNQIMKDGYKKADPPKSDAVQMVSVLISSDKEFFDKLTPEKTKEFFQSTYEYLKEMYGEKNIVNAMVHLDEKTPHMTFQYVPLTDDGRLCAKEINGKANLNRMQEEMPKLLKDRGFEIDRGEISKGKHLRHKDHNQHKLEKLKERGQELTKQEMKLEERQWEIETKERELKKRSIEIKRVDITDDQVKSIARTAQEKKGILGKPTGEVVLPKEDFEKLVSIAIIGAIAKEENSHLRKQLETAVLDKKNLLEASLISQQENYTFRVKANEYDTLLTDKTIAERIDDIKNPHMELYRQLMNDTNIKAIGANFESREEMIAYRMVKDGRFDQEKIRTCLRTNFSREDAVSALSYANTRIAQELAEAKETVIKEQARAERERVEIQEKKRINDRIEFLKGHPHIGRYYEYKRKRMTDTLAIFYMKNIDKIPEWQIKDAITDKGETSEYARKCISEVNKIKIPSTYEAEKRGVDMGKTINSQLQTAHNNAPSPTKNIIKDLASLLPSHESKDVSINAASRGDDLSCIDWSAMDDFDRKEMEAKMREGRSRAE